MRIKIRETIPDYLDKGEVRWWKLPTYKDIMFTQLKHHTFYIQDLQGICFLYAYDFEKQKLITIPNNSGNSVFSNVGEAMRRFEIIADKMVNICTFKAVNISANFENPSNITDVDLFLRKDVSGVEVTTDFNKEIFYRSTFASAPIFDELYHNEDMKITLIANIPRKNCPVLTLVVTDTYSDKSWKSDIPLCSSEKSQLIKTVREFTKDKILDYITSKKQISKSAKEI